MQLHYFHVYSKIGLYFVQFTGDKFEICEKGVKHASLPMDPFPPSLRSMLTQHALSMPFQKPKDDPRFFFCRAKQFQKTQVFYSFVSGSQLNEVWSHVPGGALVLRKVWPRAVRSSRVIQMCVFLRCLTGFIFFQCQFLFKCSFLSSSFLFNCKYHPNYNNISN